MTSHIVVVEDEPELLEMLGHALEDEGFTVTRFEGRDLNNIMLSDSPELFLIDLMLPGMSGIELAALLRSTGFDRTRLVGMSASSIALHEALSSGLFHDLLSKPFDLSELVRCVR